MSRMKIVSALKHRLSLLLFVLVVLGLLALPSLPSAWSQSASTDEQQAQRFAKASRELSALLEENPEDWLAKLAAMREQPEVSRELLLSVASRELSALLEENPEDWLAKLAAMREQPEVSRELLLSVLGDTAQDDSPSPRRWRLFHPLIQFGLPEDIPLLIKRAQRSTAPLERRVLYGAARGLYPTPPPAEDFFLVVENFSFVQIGSPRPVKTLHVGKWLLSDFAFAHYYRENLPVDLIAALLPLKGQAYADREALKKAMRNRLKPRQWKRHKQALLFLRAPVVQQLEQRGLLRVQLRNPSERPLMLKVSFGIWNARFAPPLAAQWVYLAPGGENRLDLSVHVRKEQREELREEQGNRAARVGLRLWEVHGAFVSSFQKLYLDF